MTDPIITDADRGAVKELSKVLRFLAKHRISKAQPLPAQCAGYPTCDGDLIGEAHESDCPAAQSPKKKS